MQARGVLRRFGPVICGVILSGSLLGTSLVDAATYYVATTGSDSNIGTEANPFRTIKKGVQRLKPGDTLRVKSGTYTEALDNTVPGGTSWNAPVTVATAPGATVTLRPSGSVHAIRIGTDRRFIVIDGFVIDGTNMNNPYGVTLQGRDLRLRNLEVKNMKNTGVSTSAGAEFITLTNLRVHRTGLSGAGHGFYLRASNNTVEHSTIFDNEKCGIQFFLSGGSVNNPIFRHNVLYNNGLNPEAIGQTSPNPCTHALFVGRGSGARVYNNVLYGGQYGPGITISSGASNARIYNNTIYNNYRGIQINGGSPIIRNNIVYQNTNGNIVTLSGTPTLSHNLTSNPLFIDPAKNNFQLQAASPAINAGVTLTEVKDDHVKVPRPQGSAYDIGAFEYTGSKSTPAVSAPANLRMTNAK